MARATVELDFFKMDCAAQSPSLPPFNRQRSFRDIQSKISKINPEVLKSVIASDSKIPKEEQLSFSPLPWPVSQKTTETAPLTIFYNGAVAVFDVPRDKAEIILKLAENGISKPVGTSHQKQFLNSLRGDMPIARKKSLQAFLLKRKERLTSVSSPYYACSTESLS